MKTNMVDTILRRIDMDRQLASFDGLHVATFAEKWSLTPKEIRRDFAKLKELKHPAYPDRWFGGVGPNENDRRGCVWRYLDARRSLFTRNLPHR